MKIYHETIKDTYLMYHLSTHPTKDYTPQSVPASSVRVTKADALLCPLSKTPTGEITTVEELLAVVSYVAQELAWAAEDVWDGVDPRCSAKIPSRLYKAAATICVDILNTLDIDAKVTRYKLDPEQHAGLRNQYRVKVSHKVGSEQIQFDFDVTNQLRIRWIWPDSPSFVGQDARVFRDGHPVRWVGLIKNVKADSPKLYISSTSTDNVTYQQPNLLKALAVSSRGDAQRASRSGIVPVNIV